LAYPFAPLLTLSKFAERLHNEFACELNQTDEPLTRDGGRSVPIRYFERVVEGVTLQVVVDLDDDELVQFSTMRSLCAQLRVPLEAFGLDLG
jgi:hypothetical protein